MQADLFEFEASLVYIELYTKQDNIVKSCLKRGREREVLPEAGVGLVGWDRSWGLAHTMQVLHY